jgi:hypothetical protein
MQKSGLKKIEPLDLKNEQELIVFLGQPLPKIAAFLTGALASGRQDIILAGGRLAQAALTAKFTKQLGVEIGVMIEKGKIKEDYAQTQYGFKSLVDILRFIDSEAPDVERFEAVKNLFFALNSVDVKEGEEFLMYQLFKISMELSAAQILMLKVLFNLLKKHQAFTNDASSWVKTMAHELGHHVEALVLQDEKVLIEKGLISGRWMNDGSAIKPNDGRLTDLGLKLCEFLSDYADTKKDWVCSV